MLVSYCWTVASLSPYFELQGSQSVQPGELLYCILTSYIISIYLYYDCMSVRRPEDGLVSIVLGEVVPIPDTAFLDANS